MKVRCTKLIDSLGRPVSQSPWLQLGKESIVLTLSIDALGRALVRIVDDRGAEPGLYSLNHFEIVEHTIPVNWAVTQVNSGGLFFGPLAWGKPGYWERYFENDPEAVRIFESEYHKIME
jgi:hypothetical protein